MRNIKQKLSTKIKSININININIKKKLRLNYIDFTIGLNQSVDHKGHQSLLRNLIRVRTQLQVVSQKKNITC